MNILLTSAGRRTSLLRVLKEAVQPSGGLLVAADTDPLAPTLFLADKAERVPRVQDDVYLSTLLEIVQRHQIRLLVPTIDTELQLLADHVAVFAEHGCHVLISQPEFVRITADKWLTVHAFRQEGIAVPESWLPETLTALSGLPDRLFLKPRDGSASMHTYGITRQELDSTLPRVPNAIIQREIEGPELTIDAYISLDGRPVHYVPRTRLRTLGGESIQGVTLDSQGELGRWVETVLMAAARLGARGAITLQAFDSPEGYLLSEINPRFGGGYPLGYQAGGHYPQWIVSELLGEQLEPQFGHYQVGLYMTRSSFELFTHTPRWQ